MTDKLIDDLHKLTADCQVVGKDGQIAIAKNWVLIRAPKMETVKFIQDSGYIILDQYSTKLLGVVFEFIQFANCDYSDFNLDELLELFKFCIDFEIYELSTLVSDQLHRIIIRQPQILFEMYEKCTHVELAHLRDRIYQQIESKIRRGKSWFWCAECGFWLKSIECCRTRRGKCSKFYANMSGHDFCVCGKPFYIHLEQYQHQSVEFGCLCRGKLAKYVDKYSFQISEKTKVELFDRLTSN